MTTLSNSIKASFYFLLFINIVIAIVCITIFASYTPGDNSADTANDMLAHIQDIQASFSQEKIKDATDIERISSELDILKKEAQEQSLILSEQRHQIGINTWIVVIMALLAFIYGLAVLRQINKRLLIPIAKIQSVLSSQRSGDHFTRCPEKGNDKSIQRIYNDLNSLLDR